MRRSAIVAGAVTVAALVGGCTSSTAGRADNPVISASVPSSASVAASTAAAPSTPAVTTTTTTTTAATTTSAAPTTASSTAIAPVLHSTCTAIGVRAIQGGASAGQEIAALQFTNTSNRTCRLVGYPTVTLLRGGRVLGRPAEPATNATSVRSLAPGETAESLLHDYVLNCQAPLSDQIKVVAPGVSAQLTRPMQLRACVLRVDALAAPD